MGLKLDDTVSVNVLAYLVDLAEDWLPEWVMHVIIIPLLLLALCLSSVEWILRYLLTPGKYWRRY